MAHEVSSHTTFSRSVLLSLRHVQIQGIPLHFVFMYFKSFVLQSESTYAVRNQFIHPYTTYPLLVL
jgi:hypothetical protein